MFMSVDIGILVSRRKYWLFTTLRREFLRTIRRRKKQFEVEFLPDIHNSPTGDFEPWQRSSRLIGDYVPALVVLLDRRQTR